MCLQLWSGGTNGVYTSKSVVLQQEPFGLPWLKGSKPPLFTQMRAIGFLVILLLILNCSRRSLDILVWKPHEIMRFWVLYRTQSWSPGLVRFGLPSVGEIQLKLSRRNSKEGNIKSLDLTKKQSHFAVTVRTYFSQWHSYVSQQRKYGIAGCGLFCGSVMCLTYDISNLCSLQITCHKSGVYNKFNTVEKSLSQLSRHM